MSFVPAFKVGVWNAWILVVPQILLLVVCDIVLRRRRTYEPREELARHTRREKRVSQISSLLFLFILSYCVFLPLRLGTAWLYAGMLVYLVGLGLLAMATLSFATTPVHEPVTRGVYRISRHPMDIGGSLIFIAIGIACASWILLLSAMVGLILVGLWLPSEERFCLDKYGDSYREYMHRTPRWMGMPKSGKEVS